MATEAQVVSDLRVNGHHDEATYRYQTPADLKKRKGRIRRIATRYGMSVSISSMQDEEGTFIRAKVMHR